MLAEPTQNRRCAVSNVLDKIRKVEEELKESESKNSRKRMKGIYFSFKEGSNIVRLVDNFLQVRTHYIAPNPKQKDKGFCGADAFSGTGDEYLPYMINCTNWDVEKEEWNEDRTCPICKIRENAFAQIRAGGLSDEAKKKLETITQKAKPRRAFKWNVIDRDDPYAIEISENNEESKVLSYKIATIGIEAWRDIHGIFESLKLDITDIEKGVDIEIIKDSSGSRVQYSARAVMDGLSVKQTPLTDEEKKLELHDLNAMCGKQTSISLIESNLRSEYIPMLKDEEEVKTKEVKETKKTKETKEAKKTKEEKEDNKESESNSGIEVSDASEMVCFGEYEEDHEECSDCPCLEDCKKESKQ